MVNTGKNQTLNVTMLAVVTLVSCVVVIGEITSTVEVRSVKQRTFDLT